MARRNQRRDAEIAKKQNLADRQQREWEQAAAAAVIKYLGAITEDDKTRAIRSLRQNEIEGIVVVANGAYVQVREKQRQEEELQRLLGGDDELNDSLDDIPFI